MAKYANDDVLDDLLDAIAAGDIVTVCNAQPTTYTEAVTTYKLADVAVTAGAGNGDWTIGNGDTNGRKLTLAQQTSIPVDTSGTATHVAISNVSGTKLLAVTTCSSQAIVSGNTVTIPAFDMEVSDPS